jgi:hypothetical protein
MIGSLFHFGRRLENKPLIFPTLFKSVLFALWVALFAFAESAIRRFLHGKGLAGASDYLTVEKNGFDPG